MTEYAGLKPWPNIRRSIKWHEEYKAYTFILETLVGPKRVSRAVPIPVEKVGKLIKGGKTKAEAYAEIFEAEAMSGFLEQVDAVINPPPKTPLEEAIGDRHWFHEGLGDFPKLEAGEPLLTYLDGGYPPDIDRDDLPYPPPDRLRVYRPEGLLGDAIARRLDSIHGEVEDWWLIETEEETGYSEYTMETSYRYEVHAIVHGDHKQHEFSGMAAMIRWIEEEGTK